MKKMKYSFNAWGYSDDCAGISSTESNDSEYEVEGRWFELKDLAQGGAVVGRVRMSFDRSTWSFDLESDTLDLAAGKEIE